MNVPQIDMIRFRAMWYSVCLASVVWYSYWILYDIFVWNKAFMQVNPVNYFGLTAAVGLILFEARIRTPRRFERPKMEQQVIALPLRIGACPYHIDYFDQPNRTTDIPKKMHEMLKHNRLRLPIKQSGRLREKRAELKSGVCTRIRVEGASSEDSVKCGTPP